MPKVNVSREVLEAELERYLASGPTDPAEAHAGAKRHRVLPLFNDFVGCWALDMGGRLLFFPWDTPDELRPVSDNPVDSIGAHAALHSAVRGTRCWP